MRGMIPAMLFAALPICASPAMGGTVQKISAQDGAVIVQFDGVVDRADVFTLAAPDRIAIDVSGATAGQSAFAGGSVQNIRQRQFSAETARIVLDLAEPAVVTNGNFSADGKSLRLSLRPVPLTEFSGTVARGKTQIIPPAAFRADPPKRRYEVTAPIRVNVGKGLPVVSGLADDSLPLVVIDAGHGGHDPGAISPHGGQLEKDVTLAIAKSVRNEILKSGRVRVALTRDTDKFIVLQDRFQLARKLRADLFIPIHADSAESPEATGGTVYTLSEVASDREAQRLAARENKANIINGVNLGGADANVSSILIDLTQRETMNVSADFAKLLLREAAPNMRIRGNSHRFASFIVLKAPDTPSVLFETGYLSNEADVTFLASQSGQGKVARALANAIQVHFARRIALR
ncbi:MAG: N-acetylmuramoyl-L-alanine amidase [Sphingorhabdus sp.]|jgi:N-acetylmuramoyl-L-alanine amidase|uniref:N-acetylmuramoyl-L-alanine amidase n=2 Tax=Sphingorhabdus sp. TaxID=1902408 RepID=UPI00273F7E77|nr:N-acetylmuramoyl-L-alanine amidase [Sphingorhabdus sp.]MDP4758137.1 N-acetylmuramoyl-L-alanine amidase [Sphingorhabdus sp.]MDP4927076.1 N-acetylmuramoyl-L-alanine amidase [Sphingorhabdus sp.]